MPTPAAIYTMRKELIILIFIFKLFALYAEPQENAVAPPRTPEQEAALQTTKMQQELALSAEQTREVYEINLRHARERQTSTSRSDALKRVRVKETELQRVLTTRQYDRLQEKRVDYTNPGTSVEEVLRSRTHPVTNPQRVEGGRAVPARDVNAGSYNRSATALPSQREAASSRTSTTNRDRDVNPTQRTATERNPEGTRYTPERDTPSSTRSGSTSPAPTRSGSTSPATTRSGSTSPAPSRSGSTSPATTPSTNRTNSSGSSSESRSGSGSRR